METSPHAHALTRSFEFPEVDVDQDKVDDSRAVLFAFFWFEHIAFLQALAVKDFWVNLGEWELVHSSPLFCQQELLWSKFTNYATLLLILSIQGSFAAIID